MYYLDTQRIKLIVYDFDGVMTDNRVGVTEDGKEFVTCNRGDGLGIGMIKSMGIPQVILSTEVNEVVQRRATKLGLHAIHGSADKLKNLKEYCSEHRFSFDDILYVGNDMSDFEVMSRVAMPVCPADAHPEIRKLSVWQSKARGGEGVIRELADRLMEAGDAPASQAEPTTGASVDSIVAQFEHSIEARRRVLDDRAMLQWLADLAERMYACLRGGGKIIFAGNGGSFADAQHLAAEFVGRFEVEREPLASICLGTNASLSTAIGNDYGFDSVFSRELKGIATNQDVLVLISTSGNSTNLLEALDVAEEIGVYTVGFTGRDGGELARRVPCFVAPSDNTARIQELHITIGHVLCNAIDRKVLQN